jgi:hypothetical protein
MAIDYTPIDKEFDVYANVSVEIVTSLIHDFSPDPLMDPSILDPFYGYKVLE